MWDVALRMGGQVRAVERLVLGWDLAAGLALAEALGVNRLIAAELLPEIEQVAVRLTNEQLEGRQDG